MTRDSKGRFSSKTSRLMVFIVIIAVSGVIIYFAPANKSEYTAPVKKELSGIDEIASRPDIKKQQELIVKEAFIKEEKAKTINQKNTALAEFDLQMADLAERKKQSTAEFDARIQAHELELESVRKEKTVF